MNVLQVLVETEEPVMTLLTPTHVLVNLDTRDMIARQVIQDKLIISTFIY